ncbi:DNA-deoxyinosine glycosylase [Rhodococcoides kyotonense]|uniref:DNA-deoxyinosine glycosylase n=1 Tax=Rhodococcoides kyotonense TaxID=398843 RepID=UPI001FE738B9|nr:DNA-deoxyinosine glycosylase [Rhodococcus kyotonensis]
MSTVHSFPPIVDHDAHTLILGSMPGVASLAANQYYAHPRNSFWPIMGDLFGAVPSVPYHERAAALRRHGIAVWDVLKLCTRHGSLDSAIEESSIVVNDVESMMQEHPSIDRIFFNGAKAESSFLRYVAPTTQSATCVRLPSTSPAHASMSYERKLDAWKAVADRG